MPLGIAMSLGASAIGAKDGNYSAYTPYALGMANSLLMLLILVVFFKKQADDKNRYDLSTGPATLAKVFEWQLILLIVIFGWLIGDAGVHFLTKI